MGLRSLPIRARDVAGCEGLSGVVGWLQCMDSCCKCQPLKMCLVVTATVSIEVVHLVVGLLHLRGLRRSQMVDLLLEGCKILLLSVPLLIMNIFGWRNIREDIEAGVMGGGWLCLLSALVGCLTHQHGEGILTVSTFLARVRLPARLYCWVEKLVPVKLSLRLFTPNWLLRTLPGWFILNLGLGWLLLLRLFSMLSPRRKVLIASFF